MQISDEHLRGRTVVAADGQAIGEVAALFIDTSTWTIVSLQIKLSKTAAEQLGASPARGISQIGCPVNGETRTGEFGSS